MIILLGSEDNNIDLGSYYIFVIYVGKVKVYGNV